MNYITFSLIAAVCFALSQVLNKLASKHGIDNKDSMMAYFMLSSGTFSLFLIPFIPWQLPSLAFFQPLAAAVALFLLGYYCFFTGIFETDASSFAPLFQLQSLFIALLTLVLGIEKFQSATYLWMVCMVVGAMIVSYHEKMSIRSFFSRGIFYIVLMQLFHAVSNIFVNQGLQHGTPIQFLFWENLIISGIFVVFWIVRRPKMKYTTKQVAPMFISSFVVGIGVISLLQAFTENLTISSVLGLLSSPIVFLITVVASRFSPQLLEHHSPKVYAVRALGLLVILVGAVKLLIG